jgi:putative copper export protein
MNRKRRIAGSGRRTSSGKRRRPPMTLLEGVLRYIELLSLTLWVGGIAFFSFIASPSIFTCPRAGRRWERFQRLHRRSVLLNTLVLFTGLVTLAF